MLDEDIRLVQTSFAKVVPIKDAAAELFYSRLFLIAPEVEPMFRGDMKDQGAKLMATLGVVVKGLSDLDALLPVAEDLAARHVTYGVRPAHYKPVGEALIWTLRNGLGDEFTAATEAAWTKAYGTLSNAMIRSAYAELDRDGVIAAE